MQVFLDYRGSPIRLTHERLEHIREHPEMRGMESRIAETLLAPQRVVESLSDDRARLYYRFYVGTRIGDKHVCVVVKVANGDSFVVTAYLTDKVKVGRQLWPREK